MVLKSKKSQRKVKEISKKPSPGEHFFIDTMLVVV
ncbi:uncharacterized protein METZ01_LOCUS267640 [marine metagenome]|uniref:Uncharacterized protein n=1 Tax=marine metagenome TaxID=408172 RepID=A0A382JSR6_9ZZZZ